jgi:hypothetical protein
MGPASGKLHLRLNTDMSPIANKYRDDKNFEERVQHSTVSSVRETVRRQTERTSKSARRIQSAGHLTGASSQPQGARRRIGSGSRRVHFRRAECHDRSVADLSMVRCYRPRRRWPIGGQRKTASPSVMRSRMESTIRFGLHHQTTRLR